MYKMDINKAELYISAMYWSEKLLYLYTHSI